MRSSNLACRLALAACAATAVAALAACGSSSTKPSNLSLTISEQGKAASYKAPKSADGGLVEVSLKNTGKQPHDAQLARLDGNHTAADLLKTLNGPKIPEWVHGEGGPGKTGPGATSSATINLPAGHYVVFDSQANGKPPTAEFDVSSGDEGDLPSTDATVTAAVAGKDKYRWEISGLHAGKNEITFDSKGKEALHHVIAAPIKGDATLADVKKALGSRSGPPPISQAGSEQTSVLDGGKSEVTTLDLKPGRYAFLCFLTDRDEQKPHFEEGLLKEVDIK